MTAHTTYAHDLAISAVSYDALLVGELVASLAARLRHAPRWMGSTPSIDGLVTPLRAEDEPRLVLVVAQRLWGYDDATAAQEAILQDRARREPRSILVVSVDDEARPQWMVPLRHCELASAGVSGVVQFVLDAIVDAGGAIRSEPAAALPSGPTPTSHWPPPPTPFLGQPRAHGALRRELDALCTEIEPWFAVVGERSGTHILDLHKTPYRVIARLDEVGVSFSWVPGRAGTVSDGRLMVIEWSGMRDGRGAGALHAARPVRECVYSAAATSSNDWQWRADVPNGRALSTANLVGEWMAGATMTTQPLVAGV